MTDSQPSPDELLIYGALFPYARRESERVQQQNVHFVHYTSAEGAMGILRSGEVWMRNALLMNDFSEVEHGKACLVDAYRSEEIGGRFKSVLGLLGERLQKQLEEAFDKGGDELRDESYLISVSEHGVTGNEDRIGRLSMWRAYGGNTGVALVLNNRPFLSPSTALNAFSSPVLYCDVDEFRVHFQEMVASVEQNLELLRGADKRYLVEALVRAFQFAVLSTKHPGFREEKEWRVIYSPTLLASDKITSEIMTIRGVPQRIFKIALRDHPDEGFTGATIPDLLERIIIGPTPYPWPVWTAFVELLREAGVDKPETRVVISGVPLRQ